jgi:hypothetical protein
LGTQSHRINRYIEDNVNFSCKIGVIKKQGIVIPGHGAVGDKSQLAFYRDLLAGTRERVAALKKQGKSLDEIVAAKPTAATDAKWGNGFRSPSYFPSQNGLL